MSILDPRQYQFNFSPPVPRVDRPTAYAVRWIGTRFRVSPSRAELIAALAGFPVEARL